MLRLLAKTCVQRPYDKIFSGRLPWTLTKNHGYLVAPFSDWLTQSSVMRQRETSFSKSNEINVFITTAIVAAVETVLLFVRKLISQQMLKKVSLNLPCYPVQQ